MSTVPPDLDSNDPEPEIPSVSTQKTGAKRSRTVTLAVVLVVLVGTGAYMKWSAVRAESNTQSARAALAADGIAVIETIAEPDDTASPFQNQTTVVRIQASSKPITDAQLPKIAVISQDMNVVLSSCPITNDGLSSLAGKNNICCLSLAKTAINDEGIKHLQGMNLRSLDLSATKITDAGLATLAKFDFPHLKEIALERTRITDAGLMQLANFKNLEWVSTGGTKVTKDGVRHLKTKLPEATILR